MKTTSEGVWQGDNPLHFALPLLILQICLVVVVTRSLAFVLKPLRQPRVIAEIIGGVLLGPSALGRSSTFLELVFPSWSLTMLDTVANIGLLFFLFLMGLEIDIRAIRRTGKSALVIAFAGIQVPFMLSIGTSLVLRSTIIKGARQGPLDVFIGVALSITAFPVLARILAELKLLTTELGRLAMSAAALNDVAAWILLALAIALSGSGSPLVSVWVLLSAAAFIAFLAIAIRPILAWMVQMSPEGEPIREIYVCGIFLIVLVAGFVTDAIGIHALFGAFMIGIMVPKEGSFARLLTEKVEDLVSSLFLPLYFVSSGLKTNVATISGAKSWALLVLVIINACVGKIVGTVLVSLLVRIPVREAIAMGFLMNTKGLVELIVLNIGRDRKVLNDEAFAILVLMALFTTFITSPIVMAVYKPAPPMAPYKHHTVECATGMDSEFRVMACFYTNRSIPSVISLIESSRGTKLRRLKVYAMHLVELSERRSSISMVHTARFNWLSFWRRRGGKMVEVAFKANQKLSPVSLRPITAVSHSSSMHDDIITCAFNKRVALIILPSHRMLQFDGSLESTGHAYHVVNQRVLRNSPCSVAILVDRGFGGPAQVSAKDVNYTICVIYFGGRDDREALAYASHMAEHPGISLTVTRFMAANPLSVSQSSEDKTADEMAIDACKAKKEVTAINYQERVVEDHAEVAAAIKDMGRCTDLFLVGRSPSMPPPLFENQDSPELGPVGGYLASEEFSSRASTLVIKCYDPDSDPYSKQHCLEGGLSDVPATPYQDIEAELD
ncbi:Cation/H(+) antiporter 19 [Rhynchospora pubera]|uniref:Cation/H(+) antiporter 19 n=1 Tax=Rhynchospora pubera TaxID=906938 RepID=A0AAV8C915_9POAL|nr:Cation/H(+) antiporter 19 [Rhynchospora pubera]